MILSYKKACDRSYTSPSWRTGRQRIPSRSHSSLVGRDWRAAVHLCRMEPAVNIVLYVATHVDVTYLDCTLSVALTSFWVFSNFGITHGEMIGSLRSKMWPIYYFGSRPFINQINYIKSWKYLSGCTSPKVDGSHLGSKRSDHFPMSKITENPKAG